MRVAVLVLALACLVLAKRPEGDKGTQAPPSAEDFFAGTDVVVLTESNYEATLAGEASALVMFYAPWCGHCKKLKPDYIDAAPEVKAAGHGVLAAIDCTVNPKPCTDAGVKGYPTLKHYKNGKHNLDYGSARTKAGLLGFMANPQAPPPPPPPEIFFDSSDKVGVLTSANFDSFLAEHKSTLVMFFAPWCGHCKNLKPAFKAASLELPENRRLAAVDCTVDSALCQKFEIKGYPSLRYFENGVKKLDYSGGRTKEAIISWMANPQAPPPPPPAEPFYADGDASGVTLLKEKDFQSFLKSNENVLVMFYAPWCGHCKNMKPDYAAAGLEAPAGFKFAAVDCTQDNSVCGKFEVKGYPTLKFFKQGSFSSDYTGARNKEGLLAFAANPGAAAAPPPIPAAQPPAAPATPGVFLEGSTAVKQLTAADFDAHIAAHPNVMVAFYAPWCGHCKKMKPAYAEAATTLTNGEFVAVDCTVDKELCSKYDVKGFPTINIFENGAFSHKYTGGRTTDAFLAAMQRKPKDEL